MNFQHSSNMPNLFQQSATRLLRTMEAYAYKWTNLLSCHLPILPEFIDNITEFFGILRRNMQNQKIVVPIKVPLGLV